MSRQNLDAGVTTGTFRQILNDNFIELYSIASNDSSVRALSGGWDASRTYVNSNSGSLNGVFSLTGNYASVYSTVNTNSATWNSASNYQGTDIKALTGFWDASRTYVNSNSGSLNGVYSLTGNYASVYSTVNTNSANYILVDGNTKGSNISIGTNDSYNLNLETDNISRLTVTNTGKVGIGTTSPNELLTVAGNISASGSYYGNGSLNIKSTTGNAAIEVGGLSGAYIDFKSPETDDLDLRIGTSGTGGYISTQNSTNLHLVPAGNVGIGTFSPNEKLTVAGNISSNNSLYVSSSLFINNNSNEISTLYVITSSVGINTETPNVELTVNGRISSNNVIFSNNGNSNQWNSNYSLVQSKSANWDLAVSSGYQGTDIKALTGFWDASRTYVNSNSGSLNGVYSLTGNYASVYSNVQSKSANWDITYTNQSKYLPLSGGTVTGNITVYGNVSATGNSYFANTVYSTTSALSVVNIGNTGPALYIGNNGTGDIASFYDLDQNVEIFHIGGNNGTFPNVGVKTSTPNVAFTVNGQISSNNTIYSNNGNSDNWNSNYTLVQGNSAKWVLEDFIVACSDEATSLTTTTSAVTFRVPFGMYLNSIRASVNVAPVGSTIIVDVKQTGTSIFSTKLSIDANEETSTTATTPAVISNPNLTDNAKVVVSIDQVGSSTAGSGLKLTFKGYRV